MSAFDGLEVIDQFVVGPRRGKHRRDAGRRCAGRRRSASRDQGSDGLDRAVAIVLQQAQEGVVELPPPGLFLVIIAQLTEKRSRVVPSGVIPDS